MMNDDIFFDNFFDILYVFAFQKHKEYLKSYQKIYRAKKKQELENIKKEQGDFDKNAVLTPSKT